MEVLIQNSPEAEAEAPLAAENLCSNWYSNQLTQSFTDFLVNRHGNIFSDLHSDGQTIRDRVVKLACCGLASNFKDKIAVIDKCFRLITLPPAMINCASPKGVVGGLLLRIADAQRKPFVTSRLYLEFRHSIHSMVGI